MTTRKCVITAVLLLCGLGTTSLQAKSVTVPPRRAAPAIPPVLLNHLLSTTKPAAPVADDVPIFDGFPIFVTTTGRFSMMTMETLDSDSPWLPKTPEIPDFAAPYSDYINLSPELQLTADFSSLRIPLPRPNVDHTAAQTPVRDQGSRPTCAAHALVAAIEAQTGVANLDLSEEYVHHQLMLKRTANCCLQKDASGNLVDVNTLTAAGDLKNVPIPVEGATWGYHGLRPFCIVSNARCYPPRHDLQPVANPTYEMTAFDAIGNFGLTGASIRNTAYLEVLLAFGYNIAFATGVAWDSGEETGTIGVDIVNGAPRPEKPLGHALLLVGYDRPGGYFIAKNSMGANWGFHGYAHFSYDYLRTYARYGFVVRSVVEHK